MRKVHLKVVLDVFVKAADDLDVVEAVQEAIIRVNPETTKMDVEDVTVEGVEVTDSR